MMERRVVFIGESPLATAAVDDTPLNPRPGSAGHRLFNMTAFRHRTHFVEGTCRINLLPAYPGDRWPVDLARRAAKNLIRSGLLEGRDVVLLGSKVRDAFGLRDIQMTVMFSSIRKFRVGWIPHPSGRNRFYNVPDNVEKVRTFLEEVTSESAAEWNEGVAGDAAVPRPDESPDRAGDASGS